MRAMKDSGIAWIGEIAQDFEIIKLKYLCDVLDQYRSPITADQRNKESEVLYDYYGASGAIDKIDGYTIDDHVMLIGEDGANLRMRNLPLMYEVNGKAWINNHAHILKPKTGVDFYYLFYALESLDLNPYITGSAQPKLSQENLNNILIPVPSYDVQSRISLFLKSKCHAIDTVINQTCASVEEYKRLKQVVITQAVTKGIRPNRPMKESGVEWIKEIPFSWEIMPSRYLFRNSEERKCNTDELLTSSQKYGIIPQEEYMRLENAKVVLANKGLEDWKHVDPYDFIISLRSFQGGLEMSEIAGCITWHYIVLKATRSICHDYYKWFFKSSLYIKALQRTCNYIRDGQDLRYSNFVQVPLPVPSEREQIEIAEYLNKRMPRIDDLIDQKRRIIDSLEKYKKSLIYEYVTGKKEVFSCE